uniref:CARD domain-containing protein n=1 Tax=Steinernema glaseri TaxID=37863 RepID=A0A1I8AM00_9BILA
MTLDEAEKKLGLDHIPASCVRNIPRVPPRNATAHLHLRVGAEAVRRPRSLLVFAPGVVLIDPPPVTASLRGSLPCRAPATSGPTTPNRGQFPSQLLIHRDSEMETTTARMPCSRSLADIRAEQAQSLDRFRAKLTGVNVRDLVPILVARQVLRSHEMGAVYSKPGCEEQIDKLIEILKTKNHWMGPMTDAFIRNGKAHLAEELLKINGQRGA